MLVGQGRSHDRAKLPGIASHHHLSSTCKRLRGDDASQGNHSLRLSGLARLVDEDKLEVVQGELTTGQPASRFSCGSSINPFVLRFSKNLEIKNWPYLVYGYFFLKLIRNRLV